ncbi:undecaprenyldiphospho-muramoylpentapeptide beta-N-acetylglucosaminyltransferase [Saxibacter everestensis]|uniref:UDP-N-acetylglucosamine--N-acetylmuramyl-(pentapeptide) pyrophosphoryl-undecaprenol N-acetylglucosamine transferase n=1 Tax=Saxibacter everestensis TaxID=2909229 RepID=A0ABY8QWB2_9MICO|nr:undecaprenyldiphospho-muramoylpentapeptide beta-N-acetylglucosaminyltransferase [Brevibacteriaceae bacterium ZFBP1038]
MALNVLLAGGGTTGHVSPMLAVARCLRRRDPDTGIMMLGTEAGLESRLVPAAGFELSTIPRVPMPRRPNKDLLLLPRNLARAVSAADAAIRAHQADVVVGVGGYVSTPAYLAARRRGVPIVVHEANSRPGLANKVGAKLTDYVACAFPGTPLAKALPIGMPMRPEISQLDREVSRGGARAALGLDPELPTVVVTGGSLGAASLNAAFSAAAPELESAGVQVLHIAGGGKAAELAASVADLPHYHVTDYVDGMEIAYAAADLIVCRAGAGTVSEVSAVGLPAVYVPLPIGNGEQRLNAQPFVDAGAADLVESGKFDAGTVRSLVIPLVRDSVKLESMSRVAAARGVRDADERLADLVMSAHLRKQN